MYEGVDKICRQGAHALCYKPLSQQFRTNALLRGPSQHETSRNTTASWPHVALTFLSAILYKKCLNHGGNPNKSQPNPTPARHPCRMCWRNLGALLELQSSPPLRTIIQILSLIFPWVMYTRQYHIIPKGATGGSPCLVSELCPKISIQAWLFKCPNCPNCNPQFPQ